MDKVIRVDATMACKAIVLAYKEINEIIWPKGYVSTS